MKIFAIIVCILTGLSESKMSGIDLVDLQKPGGSGGSRPSWQTGGGYSPPGGSSGSSDEDDVDPPHPCSWNCNRCWTPEQCDAYFSTMTSTTSTTSTTATSTTSNSGQHSFQYKRPSGYPDGEPISPTYNGQVTTFSVILQLFLLFIQFF